MELIYKNSAILSVVFTKNNIFCTFSTLEGKTLNCISIGSKKIKGLKKITNLTLFSLLRDLNKLSTKYKISYFYLKLKGINKNKNLFLKSLKNLKSNILLIQNQNKIAYGGCKITKRRRV